VKVFQLFSKGGIKILVEHKELVSGFPETNSDGSAGSKADFQDKSSLSIFEAGHNKHVDILHFASAYVNKKIKRGRTPLHLAAGTGDT
jgi:ankyrin repeat protein